jgi:WD40 repeat protein
MFIVVAGAGQPNEGRCRVHPGPATSKATPLLSQGHTRRVFLHGSAAVAGGVMLSGLSTQTAHADDEDGHDHGTKRATCVALCPELKLAFTSDDNGQLIKYQIVPDGLLPVPFTRGHTKKAAYVAVAGNRVLTAGYDGNVIVHDVNGQDEQAPPIFTGHRADKKERQVWVAILSSDAKLALSATNDGQILLWDPTLKQPKKLEEYTDKDDFRKAPIGGLAFLYAIEGKAPTHFLSTYSHGDLKLWDMLKPNGPALTLSHNNSFHVNGLVAQAIAGSNSRQFVSGGFDGTVRIWVIPDINKISAITKEEKHKIEKHNIKAHKNWVWRVALAPDRPLAASASEDGKIRVWNTITGKEHCAGIDAGKGGSMGVAFGPDKFLYYTLDGSNPQKLLERKLVL